MFVSTAAGGPPASPSAFLLLVSLAVLFPVIEPKREPTEPQLQRSVEERSFGSWIRLCILAFWWSIPARNHWLPPRPRLFLDSWDPLEDEPLEAPWELLDLGVPVFHEQSADSRS